MDDIVFFDSGKYNILSSFSIKMRFDDISSDKCTFYYVILSQWMYMTFSMFVNATFSIAAMVILMDATIP